MSDTTVPELGRTLTVTEAALIDAQRGREAMAQRHRQMNGGRDPAVPLIDADTGPHAAPWDAATQDALTRPVRLEIAFPDPLKVREQIDILLDVLQEARVATYDHSPGIARQMLRIHSIIKNGAIVLTYTNGKAPSGKRKKGAT